MARTKATRTDFSVGAITNDLPESQQPFILMHAVEGFGKSSLAACLPDPVFLMVGQDKGVLDLIKMRRIKKVRYVPTPAKSWMDIVAIISEMIAMDDFKLSSLVVDGINLAEPLLVDYLVDTKYGGSRDKATMYNKVYKDYVGQEFAKLITSLQRLQETKNCMIFMTAHTAVLKFKNPDAEDFGIYGPAMSHEALVEIIRPCSACLFGQHLTFTKEDANKKIKGYGGTEKVIFATRQATHIAKNRYGLPDQIDCPEPGESLNPMQPTWDLLCHLITEGKQRQEQLESTEEIPETIASNAA